MSSNEPENRQIFRENLESIPFPDSREDWRFADAEVQDGSLQIFGHDVMGEWADPYMKDLAKVAATTGGRVLEFGYGLGLSARYIQEEGVAQHVIIEANARVFADVMEFARRSPGLVTPIFGLWEEVTPMFADGSFDGILFDTYPIQEEDLDSQQTWFKLAHRLLRPGGFFTYFSGVADTLGAQRDELREAGFTDIDERPCAVTPPEGHNYWRSPVVITPIVRKT